MSGLIEHEGRIVSVGREAVQVEMVQTSACAACHAKGACGASERKDHVVEALTEGKHFEVGQQVLLYGTKGMGFWSVMWAYVIPSALILLVIILATLFGMDELHGGLLGLGVLIPYYLVLYLFRDKLRYKLRFFVRPL